MISNEDVKRLDVQSIAIKESIEYNKVEKTVNAHKLSKIMNFYPDYDDELIKYYLSNNHEENCDNGCSSKYYAYSCAKLIKKIQNNIDVTVHLYIDVFNDRNKDVFFDIDGDGFEFKAYLFLNIPMKVRLCIEYI